MESVKYIVWKVEGYSNKALPKPMNLSKPMQPLAAFKTAIMLAGYSRSFQKPNRGGGSAVSVSFFKSFYVFSSCFLVGSRNETINV